MEIRSSDNLDSQALDLAIQQNAIREGMIRPAPFKLDDLFLRPRAVGVEVLAEIMRPLPVDTLE